MTKYFINFVGVFLLNFIFLSVSSASTSPAQSLDFAERFENNPLVSEFNNLIIKGKDVPPATQKQGQQDLDTIKELDEKCEAMTEDEARKACFQQRNVLISRIEKKVATKNPDLKLLLSQSALEAGDFSEYETANLVQQSDSAFAQQGNLMNMASRLSAMPQTPTKEALETPRPAGPTNNITQQIPTDELSGKRLAEKENITISDDPDEGFFDKVRKWWEDYGKEGRSAFRQTLFLNAVAQSPFSTMGQSGQSQLQVISASRATDDFARQSKDVDDERDRLVTQHNDIAGQGLSAINERVTKNMEVMNDITKEQDKGLQSLQHICQNQRASESCWDSGNEIPFDLLAMLMGVTGGTESPEIELPTLEPYTAWLHCPLVGQNFTRNSEGTFTTALFLSESAGQLLTLKSALPSPLHEDGCIVALDSDDGWQYLTALEVADVSTNENRVNADLTLLKIEKVHTEGGTDLADLETPYDDFLTQYWPGYLNVCQTDPVFRIGDELNLYGFEPLESEAEEPEEVVVLNGLSTFVAEENGATRFTTNGEETFYGGLVSRSDNGCFKGLAQIEINLEEETNKQNLVPIMLIKAWLASQNIALPELENTEAGR